MQISAAQPLTVNFGKVEKIPITDETFDNLQRGSKLN